MSNTLEMPPKSKTKKSKLPFIIKSLFILCLFAFLFWIYNGRVVSLDGELSAGFIPITSPMTSTISSIMVEPNAYVQAGQLIARLDPNDYLQHMMAAKNLVLGTINTAQSTAEHIAEVQRAAEDMIKRIALARHEESMHKANMEKYSIEHAKAQFARRSMDAQGGTVAQKEVAQKAELLAERNLQNSKAAFELASQSRSTIETELHKIRSSQQALAHKNMPLNNIDPSMIYAPVNGYLSNKIPLNGQAVSFGETIFQLIPEAQTQLYALAKLSHAEANNIENSLLCFILPKDNWSIFEGKIQSSNKDQATTYVSINLIGENKPNNIINSNKIRTVFWNHPLASYALVKPLFIVLSYLP